MDYINRITAERLENAYKFECRYCKDKFDTRTDFFITADHNFPREVQMYCSKYCANEENWSCDYTEHNYYSHTSCDNCDFRYNKYKDPYYTAELIPECDDELFRRRTYCVACEEAVEEDIKNKITRNLEFHNEDRYDCVKIKDDDMGLCNVCNKFQPICKFLENDKIEQPCKDCFDCEDCGNNCEPNGECFDCEIAPNIVGGAVAEKAKCPDCGGPDGDDCVPCMVKKDAEDPFYKDSDTYIVRCGFYVEEGEGTIVYNGNDFSQAVKVFEGFSGKYKWSYEWVELYDNETYDEDGPIKVWDRDSEAYQEDKKKQKKGSGKVSKKFPPKTEKEIKKREKNYAEVYAEVKEKYGKMTNKQLYEFLVENRKTVKTPKGKTKDVYLSALVALTMYGDLHKYKCIDGYIITLPKYRTA